MTVTEKVAYLKGLTEGLGLDTGTKEGKVLSAIVDTLDIIAVSLADVEENALALGDEIDEISEDLADVEKIVYGEDEDDFADDEDEDGDTLYEVKCPTCNEEITVDGDVLSLGGIECPKCGEKLEFDFDGDEDDEEEDKE